MTNKLLYFPYIDIPKNSWTIKSLLYWDEVGIIVPQNYIDTPERYDKFTRDLLESDLIKQVFPYNYLYDVPNFDAGFINLTQGERFDLQKKQYHFQMGNFTKIHVQKFGHRLLNYLNLIGIARQVSWDWYEVERTTANLIMNYLATVIGKVGGFTPATDQVQYMPLRFKLSQSKSRMKLIEGLIPYPTNINLTSLRRFKDKYHAELRSFRVLIEQVVIEVSLIKDTEVADEKLELKIAEIKEKKEIIINDLNQFNFKQVAFGTLCGIAGAMYGVHQDNHPLALFSFANAVYSAFQGYNNEQVLTRDYSFLALIDEKLLK